MCYALHAARATSTYDVVLHRSLRHQKNKHRADLHWTVPLTDGACRIGLRRWPAVIIKTNQFRKTLGRSHNTSVHFASADKKRRPVTTSNFSRPVHTHRPKAGRRQAQHWIPCMSADVADSSSSNASQHAVLHSSRLLHTNVSMRVQPSLNHMAQKLHTDGTAWRTRKRGKSKPGSMIQDGTVSHTLPQTRTHAHLIIATSRSIDASYTAPPRHDPTEPTLPRRCSRRDTAPPTGCAPSTYHLSDVVPELDPRLTGDIFAETDVGAADTLATSASAMTATRRARTEGDIVEWRGPT